MRKTKLVALLLAVALIASMVVPGVAAEGAYTISVVDYTTKADAITADAGTKILVQLQLSGNPGISSLAAELTYPEGWTITMVQEEKLFASANPTFTPSQYLTENPYYVNWVMANGTAASFADPGGKLSTENGALYSLQIEIPADEMSGDYELTLNTTGRLTNYNYALDTDANGRVIPGDAKTVLTVATKGMTVTVNGTEPEIPAGAACPEHPANTTWTEVAENAWAAGGALTSGHYKLTGNQATTAALTVAEGETVCVDLNGFNITAGAKAAGSKVSYRVFTNEGTLAILDTTATGEGEAYTAGTISGGALKVQGENGDNTDIGASGGNIYNSGTFTLVDGIIADGYLEGGAYDSTDRGGNIFSTDGTLNIKGGVIRGGKNVRTSQNGGTSSRRGGGNIAAFDTDVNITGGVISGGTVSGTYGYSNTTARTSYLYGGNMLISGGSLDIANATIADGKINYTLTSKKSTVLNSAYGGNIYLEKVGDVTLTNSKIIGGQVKAYSTGSSSCSVVAQGGNIYMNLSAATSKMSIDANSVISGGVTDGTSGSHAEAATAVAEPSLNFRGGNIYLNRGTLDIYGKVTNGSGQRGSIFTPGDATINVYEGAELFGSESVDEYGHEITITARSGILNVYGGTISTAKNPGAAVYALYADVNISGGIIENTDANGFAIMTYTTAKLPGLINQTNGAVMGKVKLDDYCQWNVTGGVIDGRITDKGTLTIGANVTSYQNPEKFLVDCVAYNTTKDAENVVCYKTYADLTAALAAAQAGDVVTLVADATATAVEVKNGVTLDLNGKTLTADGLVANFADTHIVDSIGTGKLAVEKLDMVNPDNKQLPVAVDGGYVFEEITIKDSDVTIDGNKAVYKFYIENVADQTMLDDAIKNGKDVKIQIYVTWTDATGDRFQTFELNAQQLAAYAGKWDTNMIRLTITGIEGVTNLNCVAQVVSGGVTVGA